MKGQIITRDAVQNFKQYLWEEEKSENTIEKYIRDVRAFMTVTGKLKWTNNGKEKSPT
ncbi:MAG: site-specific integrase, partial [Neglectibacter timonensis]